MELNNQFRQRDADNGRFRRGVIGGIVVGAKT
jgi:hypothetical protein